MYFASAAPPVKHPNVYGIDMPSADEFIAHDRDVANIAKELGIDWLIYQDLDDLIDAVRDGDNERRFDTSCFDGHYVTGDVAKAYLSYINAMRNDAAKRNIDDSHSVIDLHNI